MLISVAVCVFPLAITETYIINTPSPTSVSKSARQVLVAPAHTCSFHSNKQLKPYFLLSWGLHLQILPSKCYPARVPTVDAFPQMGESFFSQSAGFVGELDVISLFSMDGLLPEEGRHG